MTSVDPLSDVLRSVRLRGSVFFEMICRDQWSALAPGAHRIGPAVMPGAEQAGRRGQVLIFQSRPSGSSQVRSLDFIFQT